MRPTLSTFTKQTMGRVRRRTSTKHRSPHVVPVKVLGAGGPAISELGCRGGVGSLDGAGNTLGLRFVDQTGQMFQEGGAPITWKGWRYVVFPMDRSMAAHRGGAKDGVIHYPIRWDTLFLINNVGPKETQSAVFISAPTLMFSMNGLSGDRSTTGGQARRMPINS